MPSRAFRPSSMTVYDGQIAVGRIVETALRKVEAYHFVADTEKFLGTFQTRTAAMRAVSAEKAV
jgi:hypothetical protein